MVGHCLRLGLKPRSSAKFIQLKSVHTSASQLWPSESLNNTTEKDITPIIKSLYYDVSSVSTHDVGRYKFLGNRFCKFASFVHHYLTGLYKSAPELSDVSHNARLRIQNLAEWQYQPTEKQIDRFEALSIPPVNWDLAMLENCDKMDDEELQLMAKWRRDFVKGDYSVGRETCKAIIGAYLDGRDYRQTLLLMSWLGCHVLPSNIEVIKQDGTPTMYTVKFGEWQKTPSILEGVSDIRKRAISDMLVGYSALQGKLSYKFNDRPLLLEAVAHQTFSKSSPTIMRHNGLLSHLGNAAIDFLVAKHYYNDSQNLSGDECLDRHSLLLSDLILGNAVVRTDIHKFLRHKQKKISTTIRNFQYRQQSKKFAPEKNIFSYEERESWITCHDVPRELSNLFEALLGAVYLDSNLSLDVVWQVFEKVMGQDDIKFYSELAFVNSERELDKLAPNIAYSEAESVQKGRFYKVVANIEQYGQFTGLGPSEKLARQGARRSAWQHIKSVQNN